MHKEPDGMVEETVTGWAVPEASAAEEMPVSVIWKTRSSRERPAGRICSREEAAEASQTSRTTDPTP